MTSSSSVLKAISNNSYYDEKTYGEASAERKAHAGKNAPKIAFIPRVDPKHPVNLSSSNLFR